jgi:tubulin polyglutamylase TTLL9
MSEYFRASVKKEHFGVQPNQIKFKSSLKNTIYEALKRRTWKETESDIDFDFYWSEKNFFSSETQSQIGYHGLGPHQRVNHFPNNYELTRKDLMYKNLRRYKKQLEKENKLEEAKKFNFYPQTFYMPNEYSLFMDEYKKNQNAMWIMKPAGKAQGRGIFLITSMNQIISWKNSLKGGQENLINELYIAQKYLMNPLLVGGKKFDLRIYALVTSYNPLTVYLYRTGFARFTHHRYSTNTEDLNNNLVHLTNVAVQKTSDNYDKVIGGKWDLRNLKVYLMSKYSREKINTLFSDIQDIVLKSLNSVQKVIVNDRHCFELYGYDILIDQDLKPWLIEINANPSLTANTQKDSEMKIKMLDDMLTILDLEKLMQGNEDQVGGFDIIYRGQQIKPPENYTYGTLLGAFNNREKQLKSLSKQTANRLANLYLQKNLGVSNPSGNNSSNNQQNMQNMQNVNVNSSINSFINSNINK